MGKNTRTAKAESGVKQKAGYMKLVQEIEGFDVGVAVTDNRIIRKGTKAEYMKQVQDSEGFDVNVRVTDDGGANIVPMFDDISQANHDYRLRYYSLIAVDEYNLREGSDYDVTEVVKACTQAVFGVMYYITFKAMNTKNHPQDFQAKVHRHLDGTLEIVLVRPELPIASSFYNRIIQGGYGPEPEYEDELDSVAAWITYFDRMSDVKRYHLIRNVFADDRPKEWSIFTMRVEWLNGVDKDVTSHSRAFANNPRYQYMWQNGYGPTNGKYLSCKGWEKYDAEMTEDERKEMDNALFVHDDPVYDNKMWKAYRKQGFDVDVFVKDGCGTIEPMFYDKTKAKDDVDLFDYSTKALAKYNIEQGTDYTVKEVVNACHQAVNGFIGFMYYITFRASSSESRIQDFQAKVYSSVSEVEIELVRTKP